MPIYLQHGNLIDYVPPTDTSTEDVVFMGGLVGIPQAFIQAGELGALSVDGVYMFNKKDGVAVNLGEVVKYCGTTKLAQDSDANLPLGVAVADAEADDFGVKVKINSVLPTEGGGGGGGGEIAVSCGLAFTQYGDLYVNIAEGCGLNFNGDGQLYATGDGGGGGGEVALCGETGLYLNNDGEVAIRYCGDSAIKSDPTGGVYLAVCGDSGLYFQNGELVASGGGGGGGGGEVTLCGDSGLYFDGGGNVAIRYCGDSAIKANSDGVFLAVCGDSGLYFQNGELVASGGGGGEVAIDTSQGLINTIDGLGVNIGEGLAFYCGMITLKVCTASGLSIDENGYLTYTG